MASDSVSSRQIPASGSDNGFAKFELNTVFIALRCWWKIAMPLGLLAAAGAGSLVYYMFQPTYTASAWIFIGEKARQIMPSPSDDSHRFVANQIELMKSPYLLTPVATQKDIRATPEITNERDPFSALKRRLVVDNQGQSEYYSIEFSSKSPEKAALIVNAVADAYIRLQRSNQDEQRKRIVDALDGFRQLLERQVSDAEGRVKTLAETMRVELNDPLLGSHRETPDGDEAALASLQSELIK